jgi:hypothetical protein
VKNQVAKIESFTPKQALKIIETTEPLFRNRGVNVGHVQALRTEMREGRWDPQASTIIFAETQEGVEYLFDGQHRMCAIAGFNKPVKVMVRRGVDSSIFENIDAGRPRTLAQIIAVKLQCAATEGTHIAIAAKLLFSKDGVKHGPRTNPAMAALIFEAYPELSELFEKYRSSLNEIKAQTGATQGIVLAQLRQWQRTNPELADIAVRSMSGIREVPEVKPIHRVFKFAGAAFAKWEKDRKRGRDHGRNQQDSRERLIACMETAWYCATDKSLRVYEYRGYVEKLNEWLGIGKRKA